jgi:hypothetical protein
VVEVANQLHRRLGQTQLAQRKTTEREADVLDGDRRPFRRAFFTGGRGGGDCPSACASNPCYLCVAAALSASEALAFWGTRPPLSRSPGCGGGAWRRQRVCAPLVPGLRGRGVAPPKAMCPPGARAAGAGRGAAKCSTANNAAFVLSP